MGLGARIAEARDLVRRFIVRDLWSPQVYARQTSEPWRFALILVRTLYLVWAGFNRERLRLRAAALTYMTLLSLVPAVAVVFSVVAAFQGLEAAKLRLTKTLIGFLAVPHQPAAVGYLDRFVGNIGAIGGIGIVILFFTTLSLLANVERSFNDIWGLKEDRSLVRRFQSYWPLLTLGPLLFGVSLTITASIESSYEFHMALDALPVFRVLVRLGPLLLTWFGFAMAYIIMPNTRVPVRYALIGGVVAGTLWEVAKYLFAFYTSRAVTLSAIYGSLGVVPLTIIWIYISWLIALIGGLLTFASQNALTYEPGQDELSRLSESDREHIALRLLVFVHARFEAGEGPTYVESVLASVSGPPRNKRAILGELVAGGLLTATDHHCFSPARPPHRTTVGDVMRVIRQTDRSILTHDEGATEPVTRASAVLRKMEDEAFEHLDRISVAQLLTEEGRQRSVSVAPMTGNEEPAGV